MRGLLMKNLSRIHQDLSDFLISRSLTDDTFLYRYYWALRLAIGPVYYQQLQRLVIALNNKKQQLGVYLQHGYMVLHLLMESCTNNIGSNGVCTTSNQSIRGSKNPIMSPTNNFRKNIFNRSLERHEIVLSTVPNPLNPEYFYNSIHLDQVTYIDSASRPAIIPIQNSMGDFQNLLLKQDDLRTDELIIKCIKLARHYLVTELHDDYHIITYEVLPMNHHYGFIEIIEAKTIHEITKKTSLLNYVLDQNQNQTVVEVRNRFMKSCAAYCVLTYLFGIGDRHLNNIMVTPQGHLFHIDYNFILGRDPKPIVPHLRITSEMTEFLGGERSEGYKQFQDHCFRIFLTLKRHASIFLHILSSMCNANPPYPHHVTFEILKREIIARFLPGLSETEAREHFQHTIESSQGYNTIFHRLLYHPDKIKWFRG